MRLSHISLTASDAPRLATFYQQVFGCNLRRPAKKLSGARVSRGNGLPGCEITSVWLQLPEGDRPFLEILSYTHGPARPALQVNTPGTGHLAFRVDDINETIGAVIRAGGTPLGDITNFGSEDAPILAVYMRDCEGNVIELEQHGMSSKTGSAHKAPQPVV